MSTALQQQARWRLTPKAYAALMGLPYPITMAQEESNYTNDWDDDEPDGKWRGVETVQISGERL